VPTTAATAATPAAPALRLALYSGIYVHHDAVSNSLLCKLRVLDALRRRGAPIEWTVFTHASDYRAREIRTVGSVGELLRQDGFWGADAHLFEFGMRYDLFDAVFVVPEDRPILVVDHNTTPPSLVDIPEVKVGCELSLLQRNNLSQARRIVGVSQFNLDVDRDLGFPEDAMSVLHLPAAHAPSGTPRTRLGTPGAPVELLYLGRFVRAKGISDLLAAVTPLWEAGDRRFTLTLAGNARFSDPLIMAEIDRCLDRFGADGRLRVVVNVHDEDIAGLFERADAFVIPSYHEGFCVPVVEALNARCCVIGYDAGNLPSVTDGLGQLVPTGDVRALRAAVAAFVDAVAAGGDAADGSGASVPCAVGPLTFGDWAAHVADHLAGYSEAAYELGFLDLLERLATDSPAGWPVPVAEAVAARRAELATAPGPAIGSIRPAASTATAGGGAVAS
jgi:glycosyltransferase involved in cell wall biosynthesis